MKCPLQSAVRYLGLARMSDLTGVAVPSLHLGGNEDLWAQAIKHHTRHMENPKGIEVEMIAL